MAQSKSVASSAGQVGRSARGRDSKPQAVDSGVDAVLQRRRSPIDVFVYMDYRAYLADFYLAKKPQGFSYRAFSRKARLGAPNYLKLVITGKRNLTPAMAARFAHACGLDRDAAAFFERLVAFNQATSMREREACYARVIAFARYRRAHKLELAHAAYHANWYLPAIRELCASPGCRADPAWLAAALCPPIKPSQARKAVAVLLSLGLVERTSDGGLRPVQAVLSTGEQPRGVHIVRYHAVMMRRATEAMDLIPAAERDITSLTMCLSADGITRFKARLQAFRRELIELAEQEVDPVQAVQLNLQLFPLSTRVPLPPIAADELP